MPRVRRAVAAVLCVVAGGCSAGTTADVAPTEAGMSPSAAPASPVDPQASPTDGTTPPASAAPALFADVAAEDLADDLAQLVDSVERIHPEGLRDGASLPTAPADVAALDGPDVLVATMTALAGRVADGHTGVFPTAQDDLGMWPVQLYDFDDGWRVVAADTDRSDLVGRAVTGIGGRPVDQVADLVADLVPHDNAASRRGRTPLYLVVPDVLRGLGVEPSLELDGEVATPGTIPAAAYASEFGLFSPLVCPSLPRPGTPTWAVQDRSGAVTVRYGRVVFSSDGMSHRELAERVEERLVATGATRLVVDLRDNPGGELPAADPLIEVVQRFAADHPDGVRLLAGRCTFSAAALTVAELLVTTDAVLVGEPVGGAPGIWADPRSVTLPNSGLVAHVARTWYPPATEDLPAQLDPGVAVPVSWADHRDGADPALDAALAD